MNNHRQEVIQHINTVTGNVPTHRRASKQSYSFSNSPFEQQLAIWDQVWRNSDDFWVRVHAFFFLERNMNKPGALQTMWPVIVKWQDQVDDWPLCDALAKIYTKALVVAPVKVYAQLRKWNKDPDLWKRRQSVVSLLYYSRTKKTHLPFSKIEKLVTTLLSDKEYYVQKGVGWTLREMYTVYPRETFPYLSRHIKKISSIAFTIAIEKMNAQQKVQLKTLRKK
ncbi:MAG TPA: DNA alkylation repair protein [Candidatus Paceibacterota bacterium]|jgi:3-methyladenine DNA glycosylase AlkD|nr:DNA alkylation repair protein [Candidatus Paceibacterota bacterium]